MNIKKLKTLYIIIAMLILISGCSKTDIDDKRNSSEGIDGKDLVLKKEIEAVIKKQLSAIDENNIKDYLITINTIENEYIAERKSWFRDIQMNNITDLNITVLDIKSTKENEVIADLEQSYTFNNKKHNISFPVRYIKVDNKWLDSDIAFNILKTDHYIIRYPDGFKENALLAAKGAEEAYQNMINRIGIEPRDNTVIKLYQDHELLRQSVKLSFAWQFAGWYEYPESIKSKIYDTQQDYREVIEHELTHKITIGAANNNLPYWFAEGLAMYYTEFYDYDINNLNGKILKEMWSMKELEGKNLEAMTDNTLINRYYNSSGLIVQFIAQEFGKQKLNEIVLKLGEYSYIEGTGLETDKTSIERFHKVVSKVLGISVERLDKRYIENIRRNQ
ncbi:hypothetical protein [Brassicibacter mesophilus]|uniref:hypothetical protein n=1 Tax=Brassicibacter mesophilus TaxID=745119 RepID=UPI003D1A6AAC